MLETSPPFISSSRSIWGGFLNLEQESSACLLPVLWLGAGVTCCSLPAAESCWQHEAVYALFPRLLVHLKHE